MRAFAYGALAGGLTAALLLLIKKKGLEARARRLQADLESPTSQAEMALAMQGMRSRLSSYANTYADQVAHRSGDEHMAAAYGITPERVRGLQVLIQRFTPPRL